MQPRMKNPAIVIPEAMAPIQALYAVSANRGVPASMLNLIHLRVYVLYIIGV